MKLPHEESGAPPGHDDYMNPDPEPGEPNREHADQAKEAIEQATELQKKQKAKQDSDS
jgi:hypothetical protein